MLIALLSSLPFRVAAQTTVGNFTYTFSGTEATITATSLTSGDIVIPETVTYGGTTYDVTAISYSSSTTTNGNFIKGSPTSVTGNSIKSITGGINWVNYDSSAHRFITSWSNVTSISFPKLESLTNCEFVNTASALTSLSLPALKTVEGVLFIYNCAALSSISIPLLETMNARSSFHTLPALTALSLPSLTTISGMDNITYLAALTSLDLPALQTIASSGSLSSLTALTTLSLPELATVTNAGFSALSDLTSLTSLYLPKLMLIQGQQFLASSNLSVINLPYGCEINVAWGTFSANSSTSLTITGVTKITDNYFAAHCYSLKHLSLPDVKEISSQIGYYITNIESIDVPNLTTISNCQFFNASDHNANLTTVSPMPHLTTITNSTLFQGAPITSLTIPGNLQADANSAIYLSAYPTVVTILDSATVNDNPATLFANVTGGRFIAPEGKAALFALKWNLPLTKTMVYSPVAISKSTAGTLYASGSIPSAAGEYAYNGTTYTNYYDFANAMTAAECADSSYLGPNDVGFTPSLSSLSVTNYTNPWSSFAAYAASAYTDDATTKLGTLTLTSLSSSAGTVQGFGSSAATTYTGIGTSADGFLFTGNSAAFDTLYLPYTATSVSVPSTNYLHAGTGAAVSSRPSGSGSNWYFYWHPGTASYAAGFYECSNTTIPEGRAYLELPASASANAKGFALVFANGETTGISTAGFANAATSADDCWYTLQGVRLSGEPAQGGVYIHNGKKYIKR